MHIDTLCTVCCVHGFVHVSGIVVKKKIMSKSVKAVANTETENKTESTEEKVSISLHMHTCMHMSRLHLHLPCLASICEMCIHVCVT